MALNLKEKIKTLFSLDFKTLSAIISLKHSGYFVDIGWFNAFKTKSSVGINNEPLPWVTYPFIDFILPRLNKEMDVLEFGSGNSTLFYSYKVNSVTTFEHDKNWYEKMLKSIPGNVRLIYKKYDINGNGSKAIKDLNQKFDIIIVDGIDRINSIKYSVDSLSENGVIILDDSDREEYYYGIKFLLERGFKKLDFWGISPGYLNRKSTTIFYQRNNCLSI